MEKSPLENEAGDANQWLLGMKFLKEEREIKFGWT